MTQVKITDEPFPVASAQQLQQIVWTQLGTSTKETIYCVSEPPVSQLRFVCTDCAEKNITDMVNALNGAQDLTRSAGFPVMTLKNDLPPQSLFFADSSIEECAGKCKLDRCDNYVSGVA